MRPPRSIATLLLALVLGLAAPIPASAQREPVLVFAAASMKNALDAAVAAWGKRGEGTVRVSYAASSALARQIEQGAPASIFLSADREWMDYLQERKLVHAESRADLLGNSLVLIVPTASRAEGGAAATIGPEFDLAGLLGGGRLAVGQVDAVPAGRYAKAALEKLGLWPAVAGRLAQVENVRAALVLVSRAEAPAGIVYATDAAADRDVRVAGIFPPESHPPIIYPVALTSEAVPAAAGFLAWLRSPAAAQFFERQGFRVLR